MYNLKKNNYHQKPKASDIQTPLKVSQFIFELLRNKVSKEERILDPCAGMGNLLTPWKKVGYNVIGIDLDKNSPVFWSGNDFLKEGSERLFPALKDEIEYRTLEQIQKDTRKYYNIGLILCNPPFNGYGGKLGSEVWLDKIIEIFGKETPIVLFVPAGFCLNLTLGSKRYLKFANGEYPPISSRITLPKNIFLEVLFHSEILIFNILNLEPHYFLSPDEKN